MQTISLADVHVKDDRIRRKFDPKPLAELKAGILSKGLLHPVVLREIDGRMELVAGERRFRCVKEIAEADQLFSHDGHIISPGLIPYTLVNDLSGIELKELELEENVLREDLTWQEKAQALTDLHALRSEQNPGQTEQATAHEVSERTGRAESTARRDLAHARIITPHLTDPEIAGARNQKDALNKVAKKLEAEFAGELARREQNTRREPGHSPHTLVQGDLRQVLPTLEAGRFACIVADPPYGMNADEFGNAALESHKYEDNPELALELAEVILKEGLRLTQDQAHLYLFCDVDHFLSLRKMAAEAGWRPFRTPLIWWKGTNVGHAPWQDEGPRRSYEFILFCAKGGKKFRRLVCDHYYFDPPKEKVYAAQKPFLLYAALIGQSCYPGDEVLDPCCGSGPIFKTGLTTSTRAFGIERSDEGYGLSASLIQQQEERTRAKQQPAPETKVKPGETVDLEDI